MRLWPLTCSFEQIRMNNIHADLIALGNIFGSINCHVRQGGPVTKSNIDLGGIYGLGWENLAFWETHQDGPRDEALELTAFEVVVEQAKDIIESIGPMCSILQRLETLCGLTRN
jgi:hypothetical protein